MKIDFKREFVFKDSGNRVDFLIDNKIILETKAERIITREDYYQIQRYPQSLNMKLGLLVNFRNQYIKPVRIVKIDTPNKNNYN